jgi:ABC-type branched-subunit amino acid transport system ATPase component
MPLLLEAEHVSVAYGRLAALDDVTLAIPEGNLVALLGANGAGKSTFLKAVAGLVPIGCGGLRLAGEPLEGPAHERARRGVCLIPEGRGIFPALTVAENLRVAVGEDRVAIGKISGYFPVLGQRMDQLAGTLSGGEQQMLALARAVAGRSEAGGSGAAPALLMVDELSLGLAPILVGMLFETLARLHAEEDATILLVEQYATHALRLADLVYILNRGQLVWAGEPDELRASKVLVDTYLGAEV